MILLFCLFLVLSLLGVDQIIKAWAAANNLFQQDYFLGFIRWNYERNFGMAFGMLNNNSSAMTVVTVLTVFMIIGLAILFFTLFKKNRPAQFALAVIEAGAIGNLIDRLVLGFVRDMVDVGPIGFGVCNFADFYITGGAVALVFIILFIGKDAVIPITKKWREEAKAERQTEKKRQQDE